MASNLAAALSLFLLLLLASSSTSNIDQDRTECSNNLMVLARCLPYVSGDAKMPTIDCCTGLKQVVQKSKKCLCVLIKDKDDPNLDLKINGSLALALPNACLVEHCVHLPFLDISHLALLHLAPNSREAKIFKESHSSSGPSSAPDTKVHGSSSSSSSANDKSDAGMKNKKKSMRGAEMMMEIVLGFFIFCRISI